MDIVIRAAVIFLVLYAVARLIGRRELGQMEPFDILLLVVLGDLIQQGVTQNDASVTGALLAVATMCLLTVAMSFASYRWRPMRLLLEGTPVVLIADGRMVEPNLRRERITHEELAEWARMQQIADLGDVRWAVLETTGKVSFIPR
ncbi:MAG: DUF421 domain-containing protein [Thermoleophilia bacterium]|nr:DUF421 domain-containing protein [Thermoleophilia bacterium]